MKSFAIALILLTVLCPPVLFAQSVTPTVPPGPVIGPPTEPLGLNATTFAGGGFLLAAWELARRFLGPLLVPRPSPLPAPVPVPVPSPAPQPVPPGPSQNPLYDLLRLLLERLLIQPVTATPLRAENGYATPLREPESIEAQLHSLRQRVESLAGVK